VKAEPEKVPEPKHEHVHEPVKVERDYKGIAAVVASIGALLTATAAILKPQSTTLTEKVYETLVEGVQKNQADTAELRGYIQGLHGLQNLPPLPPFEAHVSSAPFPTTASSAKLAPVAPHPVPSAVPVPTGVVSQSLMGTPSISIYMAPAASASAKKPDLAAAIAAAVNPPAPSASAIVIVQPPMPAPAPAPAAAPAQWKPKAWSDLAAGK
jgi:hypothetical protein